MKTTSNKPILYCEVVTERMGDWVIASDIHLATKAEIKTAAALHAEGKCPHNIVYDTDVWPYYARTCHTCGRSLGLV